MIILIVKLHFIWCCGPMDDYKNVLTAFTWISVIIAIILISRDFLGFIERFTQGRRRIFTRFQEERFQRMNIRIRYWYYLRIYIRIHWIQRARTTKYLLYDSITNWMVYLSVCSYFNHDSWSLISVYTVEPPPERSQHWI